MQKKVRGRKEEKRRMRKIGRGKLKDRKRKKKRQKEDKHLEEEGRGIEKDCKKEQNT